LAHRLTPFDFFSHILEAEGGRKAFAARLGAKCFDALDELLNLAEAFGKRGPLSLPEFLVSLRRGASDQKRETDQAAREVRIMTVHGAKGLEAEIVILADACSHRSAPPPPVYFVHPAKGAPAVPIWAVKGTSRLPAIAEVKDSLKSEENRELGRLLYVAMTRARDCLYITGSHKGDLPHGCWYDTVKTALDSEIEEDLDFQGRPVWRCGSLLQPQALAHTLKKAPVEATPSWLGVLAPSEPALPILLPSRLSGESDGMHSHEKPKRSDRDKARATGILIHRLLEVLPQLPAAERLSAANAIASAFAGELVARERDFAIESAFAAVAGQIFVGRQEQALAEAGIAVTIQDHLGQRRGIITGQVDRILFDGPDIHILDYKSGAVHGDAGESPHDLQLAAYRLALSRLYSNTANIKAALLSTGSVEIRQADGSRLDALLLDQITGGPEK
jgi:ATP-dependent helicase/nuclease subunit A